MSTSRSSVVGNYTKQRETLGDLENYGNTEQRVVVDKMRPTNSAEQRVIDGERIGNRSSSSKHIYGPRKLISERIGKPSPYMIITTLLHSD